MTPTVDRDAGRVSIRSVLLWGSINWVLLLLGATGVPLWAHHPFPRESVSLEELIAGQMLTASMLFPSVAKTTSTLLINLSIALAFDQFAGMFSNAEPIRVFYAFGGLTVWLLGLAGWMRVVRTEAKQSLVGLCATLLMAGGPIFDYLRWEAGASTGRSDLFTPYSILSGLVTGPSEGHWNCAFQITLPAVTAGLAIPLSKITKNRSIPLQKTAL